MGSMETEGSMDEERSVTDEETRRKIALARRLREDNSPQPPSSSMTIFEIFMKLARENGTDNWLTFYDETGEAGAFTYMEFFWFAMELAEWMHGGLGLIPGDRIATVMGNDPRTVLTYFAAWFIGVTVVPINAGEDRERIRYILHHSQTKFLFVAQEQSDTWQDLDSDSNKKWIMLTLSVALTSADTAFVAHPPSGRQINVNGFGVEPASECLIVYTSGTTGNPKGVVLEQANLIADAQSIADWMGLGPDDRAMNVLPLHHVNGTVVTLLTPLVSGGSVVINRKFRAQAFWQTLAAERCTWVSVVPTILAFLIEKEKDREREKDREKEQEKERQKQLTTTDRETALSTYDLSRFRRILCGAGPLTVELASRFYDTFGLRITHGYGLSETTCYSSFLPAALSDADYDHWMHRCGFPSIGCPLPVNEMAIHDSEGNALPPDTRGEIVIRGYNVMRHYFLRPEVNRETFPHGWFRSGDEGFYRVGDDGRPYFFITGRLKELIIRGGINLSPFDIDEVLNAIPGVRAAMAVGFENNFYGEEVGAYVQLTEPDPDQNPTEPSTPRPTAEEILTACRAKLPFAKSPKVVVFGATFPVTSTGKYQRNKLRPLFAEWKDTQFRETK